MLSEVLHDIAFDHWH